MNTTEQNQVTEKILNPKSGMSMLLMNIGGLILAVALIAYAVNLPSTEIPTFYDDFVEYEVKYHPMMVPLILFASVILIPIFSINLFGLKTISPNEALVLTLFGNYYGTINKAGFFYVNPFCSSYNPTKTPAVLTSSSNIALSVSGRENKEDNNNKDRTAGKKISLKAITLNNQKQKVNDLGGNPIEIGAMVVWKVINPCAAVFSVDNYLEFISMQSDSTLRNVASRYAYDDGGEDSSLTLRGDSDEIALLLKEELQKKVEIAGLEVMEVKITHLAYAPEIASAMLQRQQASAILAARRLIVEGAVGMVQQALAKLDSENIVELDDERKATMISNLLVVLCANKEAQPVVNSGSIY
ncbi:MAG: SPFH domain-containing protein [Eubacteriales bacterium]